ncbi:MAG TPA: hypothetical protein VMJ73_02880 [Rhizomicrobium sp.]|nr:hypothetical protein [Rhizomicrobium sp.]
MPNYPGVTAPEKKSRAETDAELLACKCENVTFTAKLFIPSTQDEIDCTVTELTPHAATVEGPTVPDSGADIVLYVEGFDRFPAFVQAGTKTGAILKFTCSDNKKIKTAEKIRKYLAGEPIAPTYARSSVRSEMPAVRQFGRANGEVVEFEVVDVSLTGALLRTRCRPSIGETITIGNTEGRVTRHVIGGIAVEFIRRQPQRMSLRRRDQTRSGAN